MAEPFKNLINAELVRACGEHLQRVWRRFDRAGFEALALPGLTGLEMKARAMRIADALEATLPEDFDHAAGLIEAALAPPATGDEMEFRITADGLAGWIGWPLGEFIARRGQAHPERALRALRELTQRFTSEFAVRPFLVNHFDLTLAQLRHWSGDPNPHVRRWTSEGTRPRLPWGLRIRSLVADPSPTLPLLRALQDDPSAYVRRSVANHLNDIAKDHPDLVADWLQRYLPGASPERLALLRHASRSLIKQGQPRVLAAWGLGRPFRGEARLSVTPARLALGGSLRLRAELVSAAARSQSLLVDYVVHHVKANGSSSPKVFKGWRLELGPHERRRLEKTHPLKPITTRVYHSGRHRIELQVNGRVVAEAAFLLKA
ncbi:DNA alkylation repair protein [Arenimonas fontis]|uniref:DNA alkylation repair protein n=1 Tax=Arenimonas fontis TaxID=2608255 RepID=A0A5B2Z810_9GAMM|nr:DNA alkylation repair protein [Arenimonas fontis]KAA2284109.1 DNA alkylation repair protein [Arenimonas fontis]